MAARSRALREASGRYGWARQVGDPAKIEDTARDLAAEKIKSYVERVLADAPPLTAEQRDHIAALLRPSAPKAAAG